MPVWKAMHDFAIEHGSSGLVLAPGGRRRRQTAIGHGAQITAAPIAELDGNRGQFSASVSPSCSTLGPKDANLARRWMKVINADRKNARRRGGCHCGASHTGRARQRPRG